MNFNSPGRKVSYSLFSRRISAQFFFGETVTGNLYLRMLQEKIMPCMNEIYTNWELLSAQWRSTALPQQCDNSITDF
jgi:hypothetical protein